MNDDIVVTSSEEFENIIRNIEIHCKNIESIFQNENKNMERINETVAWSGPAQEATYNKYKELSDNYDTINESLKTFVNIMKNTVSKYKEIEKAIQNNAEQNATQLDVNS